MKCHPVAFAVEDDGPVAVRADLVSGLEHLAAVGLDHGDGLVEPPLRIQVDQQTGCRRAASSFLNRQPLTSLS